MHNKNKNKNKFKYKAFLSYSHKDEKHAKWLMRSLEAYKVPKYLVGMTTSKGDVPLSLPPIFRDRDEMSASNDLGSLVREGLVNSEFLIIICSPASALSDWVNQEVREFINIHGRENILCVIASGDPSGINTAENCFPKAMFEGLNEAEKYEPAAADLREGTDGKRLVKLKLVASLLGVELAELIRKDEVRRQQNLMRFTGITLIAMAVMGFLAVSAFKARDMAEVRRNQAENLIEFMLTDLKAELQPVGRLAALSVVGDKVIEYYSVQKLEDLNDDALGRRARSFQMLGEVERNLGNIERARDLFVEAMKSTEKLLENSINNEQRIFDHAQSVYWVGSINRSLGNFKEAEVNWNNYKLLAEKLIQLDSNNVNWQMEVSYADANLGILYLRNMNRPLEALDSFKRNLSIRQKLMSLLPETRSTVDQIAGAHAWLADALMYSGHLQEVRFHREAQAKLYDDWLEEHPDDYYILRKQLGANLAISNIELIAGHTALSLEMQAQNAQIAEQLILHDPTNISWKIQAGKIYSNMLSGEFISDDNSGMLQSFKRIAEIESYLEQADLLVGENKLFITNRSQLMMAKFAIQEHDFDKAKRILQLLLSELDNNSKDKNSYLSEVFKVNAQVILAQLHLEEGNNEEAMVIWEQVIKTLEPENKILSMWDIQNLAFAMAGVGRVSEATNLARSLFSRGYAHPSFVDFCIRKLLPVEQSLVCATG